MKRRDTILPSADVRLKNSPENTGEKYHFMITKKSFLWHKSRKILSMRVAQCVKA